ncbi:hypothetical protein M0805_008765 [Coniferiporia weirii]|nr:hypothetical protein M0805_008765 [Coniferiporia weirii]
MALQTPIDRGYLNLLSHLRKHHSTLPQETIQAAICHYLVHLPPAQPTPTPLITSIVASSFWQPLSLNILLSLGSSVRSTVQLKSAALKAEKRGLFDGSVSGELNDWTYGILAGLKDGDPLLSLAISGGLLAGLKDVTSSKMNQRTIRAVEEAVVVAHAEVTAVLSTSQIDPWEAEFRKSDEGPNERANLAVFLSAHYFPFVSTDILNALELTLSHTVISRIGMVIYEILVLKQVLASLCLGIIRKAFFYGSFLRTIQDGVNVNEAGLLAIPTQSSLRVNVATMISSDEFKCVAPVCKLLSRAIGMLSDSPSRLQRRNSAWTSLVDVVFTMNDLAQVVEDDWLATPLAEVSDEKRIEAGSREVTEKLWSVLKAQLFSTLMLHQAVLDALLFLHPLPPPTTSLPSSPHPSASDICRGILRTLFSLSFVIASFGGVTAQQHNGRGFPELKKVFYTAVDILSSDAQESEAFVGDLIKGVDPSSIAGLPLAHTFVSAKRAFALACIEQLVPVVSDVCIERDVLPLCESHMGEPVHRETFELAHSVVLSIFAAHAEKGGFEVQTQARRGDVKGKNVDRGYQQVQPNLARRLVPGYVKSLLQNAREGGLTTSQFRLAYAALVRSASTGRSPSSPGSLPTSPSAVLDDWRRRCINSIRGKVEARDEDFSGDPELTWLCVQVLLDAIAKHPSSTPGIGEGEMAGNTTDVDEVGEDEDAPTAERMRLTLTLVSLISNVSAGLLPRVLREVRCVVDNEADVRQRQVLIKAVFEEIMERIGNSEKEIAMRWWYTCAQNWGADAEQVAPSS